MNSMMKSCGIILITSLFAASAMADTMDTGRHHRAHTLNANSNNLREVVEAARVMSLVDNGQSCQSISDKSSVEDISQSGIEVAASKLGVLAAMLKYESVEIQDSRNSHTFGNYHQQFTFTFSPKSGDKSRKVIATYQCSEQISIGL